MPEKTSPRVTKLPPKAQARQLVAAIQ
jgi:hypothetical protein